jgi:hypothetical protein
MMSTMVQREAIPQESAFSHSVFVNIPPRNIISIAIITIAAAAGM